VASDLAARSDAVAQALAVGDSCSALAAARQLRQDAIAAINSRRVPAAFQEHLAAGVNDLVSRIRCVPVQLPQDNGKHKGKDKNQHGDEGD
jgi:hypothetical protein